jgi:branched-chain amino acid aminotransferase
VTGDPIWVNGSLHDADDAVVSALDHGLTVGDGLFETMRLADGRPVFWRRHLARLHDGLRRLGITSVPTEPELRRAVEAVVEASGRTEARVRLTVTSGSGPAGPTRSTGPSTVVVTIGALPTPPASIRLCTVPWVRNERSALAGVKSTSYGEGVVILEHARHLGFDEAVLTDTTGRLSEAVTANVFVAVDGVVSTPGLDTGCLPGTVRGVLLDAGVGEEAELALAALAAADEVVVTSATRGVVPVRAVDGVALPTVGGPMAATARRALDAAVDEDLALPW